MPPLAFFKNPWDLPEESDSSYEERKAFVIWYHDHFLPACAGKDFKEEIRHFRMPVQMMTIAGENPGAHVTKESEALGLIIVENCYEKWTHIVPEKAKDDEWVIPAFKKSDRSTHKYHKTKWSDGRTGQVKGCGWSPEAYNALHQSIISVKKVRKDDRSNNWKKMKRALDLVKTDHGIPLEQKTKKRKRDKKEVVRPVYEPIPELSDDDYHPGDETDIF